MKVLILGGTRLTGPHIVRSLVKQGHEVTVFHRGKNTGDLPPSVRHVTGDKSRLSDSTSELRAVRPDVVVHMMAVTEPDAHAFLEVFRGHACRAVVISSADVYRNFGRLHGTEQPGPPDPVPLTEDSPLREKLSVGGEEYNKTAVERVVACAPNLPVTILRYPAVYGPGDYQHRLYPYLRRMDDGRAAIIIEAGQAGMRFSHAYSEDVAAATALTITDPRAAGRVYHVAEPETPTWADWVRRIGRAVGWPGEVVPVGSEQLPESMRSGIDCGYDLWLDPSRIHQELGWSPVVDEAEALRRTIEWERANPPEKIDAAQFDYAAEDAVLAALLS